MIEDGLSYPFRGEWVGRVVVGTLLVVLGLLIVPAILLSGYCLRVMERTVAGEDEPPAFAEWGDMFVDGLKAIAVGFVYALVPTIGYFAIVSVLLGVSFGVGGDGGAALGIVTLLVSILVLFPLVFLLMYVLPAAFVTLAVEGRLGAAFDFGTLTTVWTSGDYLIAVVLAFAVTIGLSILVNVLAFTIVGLVVVPTLLFYSNVVVSKIWADGFAKSTAGRAGDPTATVPTA